MSKLFALLSTEGRTLENVKFFPGPSRGLTPRELCSEGTRVLEKVLSGQIVDNPPKCVGEPVTLEEATARG